MEKNKYEWLHKCIESRTSIKTTVEPRYNGTEGTDCIFALLPKSGVASSAISDREKSRKKRKKTFFSGFQCKYVIQWWDCKKITIDNDNWWSKCFEKGTRWCFESQNQMTLKFIESGRRKCSRRTERGLSSTLSSWVTVSLIAIRANRWECLW